MNVLKKLTPVFVVMLFAFSTSGCAPEVGSERWCTNMKEKAKGEWTANEAADFAKHCLL